MQYYRMLLRLQIFCRNQLIPFCRHLSIASECMQSTGRPTCTNEIIVDGCSFKCDEWTNVNSKILSYLGRNLHLQEHHPICLVKHNIVNYFYRNFLGRSGNPIFSVLDELKPVVTIKENFDSLLTPEDHPSRQKSDCYYINCEQLLRGHMTAHQSTLISMGLNNFLIVGDVYRRDEIDSTHFPVFHQIDAVRLCSEHEVFKNVVDGDKLHVFEHNGARTESKQQVHTLEATQVLSHELKASLVGLAQSLFGQDVQYRWVGTYFPFTHPSWELEILFGDKWLEILGCGITEHQILQNAGAIGRVGWAFGIGLERLAMLLYGIPDIRLFWSKDSGFLSQFQGKKPEDRIKYKPVSIFPQCANDVSFWLPQEQVFSPNDFYDLVRTVGGDIIEQVCLIDTFTHPKSQRISHCYRIVYRHMEKTLTQQEVNAVHGQIEQAVASEFKVTVR